MSKKSSNYTRRDFLKYTSAAAAAMAGGLAGCDRLGNLNTNSTISPAMGVKSSNTPNVLILTSDEHNPFISSIEGDPVVHTPNMERLAKMGTVYNSHYCPSPLCTPSRSAFMAGKYVHQLQTYNNCCVFKNDYPGYGQLLAEQDVHTIHIGKIDVYRDAYELGFSEMHIGTWPTVRDPGDMNISRNPLSVRSLAHPTGGMRHERYGVKEHPFKRDKVSINTALNWLDKNAVSINKPWLMHVNLSKPHFPMEVTDELWDMYEGHDDMPPYGTDCESANHPFAKDLRKHFQTDKYPESSIRGLRRGYYGCVTYMDRKLGKLLDKLEEQNILDNTIVVYTSDHGDMHGKFGMWWKCSLYEDSARVPLIVAGPGFKRNFRDSTAVSQLDLQASIFKAMNCQRPADWVGTPLQELSSNDQNHVAFAEYHGHGTRASSFLVRKGQWKYIYYCKAPNQLFNIQEDPQELNNVIEKYPDIEKQMHKELLKICSPEKENARAEKFIQKELAALKKLDLKIMPGGLAVPKGSNKKI